jgi:hypothetical protein
MAPSKAVMVVTSLMLAATTPMKVPTAAVFFAEKRGQAMRCCRPTSASGTSWKATDAILVQSTVPRNSLHIFKTTQIPTLLSIHFQKQ